MTFIVHLLSSRDQAGGSREGTARVTPGLLRGRMLQSNVPATGFLVEADQGTSSLTPETTGILGRGSPSSGLRWGFLDWF